MGSWLRMISLGLSGLFLAAADKPATQGIPVWLMGIWIPVEIHQDEDALYPSRQDEPRYWISGQRLVINKNSLTFADDRCENPTVDSRHGRPSVPIRETGSGTLKRLGLPLDDKPVDYLEFNCARDVFKLQSETSFVHPQDRTIKITWPVIIHSHDEIDMPFFGRSYVRFKRASPTT